LRAISARRPAAGACPLRRQGHGAGQVLHQVGGETEECLDLCNEVDFVRGVVGWLPLADPDATAQALERLRSRGGKLVGVRHLISNEPDPRWLLQSSVAESLKLLAAAKLAFDAIPVNAAQFESVLDVAERLPELKLVINHLGRPPIPEQGWEPWATQIARAAEHRNVSIKLPSVSTSSCAGAGRRTPSGAIPTTCSTCSAPIASWRRATGR
jgi:L-fuconolactonase